MPLLSTRTARAAVAASLAVAALATVAATGAAAQTSRLPRHVATSIPSGLCQSQTPSSTDCYDPAQLQVAYDVGPLYAKGNEGQHQTIVIVDAFGSPTITSDLATFDAEFGLPAPPSFKIIHPEGAIPAYSPSGRDRPGWAFETSIDVEWAHALAPMASILLVETPVDEVEGTSGFAAITAAERYVVAHKLGQVISQSFAATEETFTSVHQLSGFRTAYSAAEKANVTVLAGTGDLGATDYESNASTIYQKRVSAWPATDPLVTAVGATHLDLDAAGNPLSAPAAWNDTYLRPARPFPEATSGGHSEFFKRPSYQNGVKSTAGAMRSVPDVSMTGSCTAPVYIFDSASGPMNPGWSTACGTSLASPLFAAIVALCDEAAGHGLGLLNPALYAIAKQPNNGLVAVTSGNNTVSFLVGAKKVTVKGFTAHAGYNLATGLGTIDAAKFVPALVKEWKALHK